MYDFANVVQYSIAGFGLALLDVGLWPFAILKCLIFRSGLAYFDASSTADQTHQTQLIHCLARH